MDEESFRSQRVERLGERWNFSIVAAEKRSKIILGFAIQPKRGGFVPALPFYHGLASFRDLQTPLASEEELVITS